VTVWAGINGHGKSLVTSQVATHLMREKPCLIASLEMPIAATGARMVRQITCTPKPSEKYMRCAIGWTTPTLWLYDQLDTVPVKRIIGMCVYAITELLVSHIFIDSLMKCGLRHDDYSGQEQFVDKLCWLAKQYGVHIHLVHHIRKGSSENEIPNKFDLKGSGGITDLVDNVVIVHRNKAKEAKVNISDNEDKDIPDCTLTIAKQRHGEWEGGRDLWFDSRSQQFLQYRDQRPAYFNLEPQNILERTERFREGKNLAG